MNADYLAYTIALDVQDLMDVASTISGAQSIHSNLDMLIDAHNRLKAVIIAVVMAGPDLAAIPSAPVLGQIAEAGANDNRDARGMH